MFIARAWTKARDKTELKSRGVVSDVAIAAGVLTSLEPRSCSWVASCLALPWTFSYAIVAPGKSCSALCLCQLVHLETLVVCVSLSLSLSYIYVYIYIYIYI